MNLLFIEIQWNGVLRSKGVVIPDTGHHLTCHPTDRSVEVYTVGSAWVDISNSVVYHGCVVLSRQSLLKLTSSLSEFSWDDVQSHKQGKCIPLISLQGCSYRIRVWEPAHVCRKLSIRAVCEKVYIAVHCHSKTVLKNYWIHPPTAWIGKLT